MYRDNNNQESLTGYNSGQLWLYRLMRRMYHESGPDITIPASEIAGLMEYGAMACRDDDRSFWRDSVREAGNLPAGWYERDEAAERHFDQLGLVILRAAGGPHPAANN